MSPYLLAASAITCGALVAVGRHGQGGAFARWIAILLYGVALAPALWIAAHQSFGWADLQFSLLAGSLFLYTLLAQEFDNLWLGLVRYGGWFFFVAILYGNPFLAVPALLAWLAMKWSREPHDFDAHRDFELVLGGACGVVLGLAPLVRGW